MTPKLEPSFKLGLQAAFYDHQKAFSQMRVEIVDSLWNVPVKTRRRIIDALNRYQAKSDWQFDLD